MDGVCERLRQRRHGLVLPVHAPHPPPGRPPALRAEMLLFPTAPPPPGRGSRLQVFLWTVDTDPAHHRKGLDPFTFSLF